MASFQNNGKLKLLIIVGTRPEIIRLAAVITKCRQYFDTILAHTGQNYDYNLNGVFFHDLELADPEVYMDAVGDPLGQTMDNIIANSQDLALMWPMVWHIVYPTAFDWPSWVGSAEQCTEPPLGVDS